MIRPLTMKDIATAASLRAGGMPWAQIGVRFGKSEANIRATVVRNGDVLIQARRHLTVHERAEILARYQSGEQGGAIAADYGVDPSYPSLLARRRGVARESKP